MKLIKPYYEIISAIDGEEILKQIELAVRTCYKIAKSACVLIPKLMQRGHEAMLEFGGHITVKFICDRGVSHELVRHRLCSFAQESTRYCNYGNQEHIIFIIPCWFKDSSNLLGDLTNTIWDKNSWSPLDTMPIITESDIDVWFWTMWNAESTYNRLIKEGWSPQQARSVLPNSLKTEINISCNIREWRHIFKLRTASVAHPQMVELMRPLLKDFQSKIPILFDDITY